MEIDFTLSQSDGRPMYLQIMERIKRRVAVGDWGPGMRIPSIRELAVGLRVSVITVKRAYLELEREGVIVTRQGTGSFVAEDPDLTADLHRESLERALESAVEHGSLLGLDRETLQARLGEIYDQRQKERL